MFLQGQEQLLVKIAGKETMWIPAAAMYGPTTNPADAALVETTATRPDLKVFDFDARYKTIHTIYSSYAKIME